MKTLDFKKLSLREINKTLQDSDNNSSFSIKNPKGSHALAVGINKKIDIQTTKIKDVMTKTFKTIDSNALAVDAAKIMEENKIFTLVVLEKNKYIGVLSMHNLIEARIL